MKQVSAPTLNFLPVHLREISQILARGLLRLRSRTAEEFARHAADQGESSLHFAARQSVHANPSTRRPA